MNIDKKIQLVNRRIRSLKETFDFDTWAYKNLMARLDTLDLLTDKGYVSKKSNLSSYQHTALNKALNLFINSKTSTVKGLKKQTINAKQKLKENFEINDEQADLLNELFEQDYYNTLLKFLSPSEIAIAIKYIQSENPTFEEFNDFINRMFITTNDITIKNSLQKLYEQAKT